ncbi:MAG: alcohol dehydrogenase catalytic domain-containing protein, partial [Victivallales bacterium]|nr:alcohol dehydrogenase catalytic domain-containing protein [Victivallales bacterium]
MKAAVLHASQDIRYEECPTPEIRPGCVKINVRACGICGSDIPRVLGDAAHFFPIVLGHEFSGEVVEIADDVKNVAVGDHVVCAPLIPCFDCPDCALGNFSLCKHYTFIGSRVFGGMAEYVVIPARNAVKFSAERNFEDAALLEPAT